MGASLVVQWLKIHLTMQERPAPSLVQKDRMYLRATKPEHCSYLAHSRVHALQREKPLQ